MRIRINRVSAEPDGLHCRNPYDNLMVNEQRSSLLMAAALQSADAAAKANHAPRSIQSLAYIWQAKPGSTIWGFKSPLGRIRSKPFSENRPHGLDERDQWEDCIDAFR